MLLRAICLCGLLLCLSVAAIAQSFELRNGIVTRAALSDLCAVGEFKVWAVGDGGVIIHSTDGGITWQLQNSGTTRRLWDVFFLNDNNGWAVGDCTTMRRTLNGGETWLPLTLPTRSTFECVRFTSAEIGWIVGSDDTSRNHNESIWQSTDGGLFWARLTNPDSEEEMYCADFIDDLTGWVAGYGDASIWFTEDAGQTWTAQDEGSPFPINDIFIIDDTTVCAVGYGGDIFRTTNRGTTWTRQTSGTSSSVYNVEFTDLMNGWAVTAGPILRTTNGGQTWTQQTPPLGQLFRGLHMLNDSTGIAVGNSGAIIRTENRGDNWSTYGAYTARPYSVRFLDRESGFVTDDGGFIWKTTNSGYTWTKFPTVGTSPLIDLQFLDSNTGYALSPITELISTTDGGQTWLSEATPMGINVEHLFVLDQTHFWTAGRDENIYFSSNGQQWTRQNFHAGTWLYDIQFVDTEYGWAVGDSTLLRTMDGGSSWIGDEFRPQTSRFSAVSFVDREHGWVVGKQGVIKRTVDGGESWIGQANETTRDLTDIQMLNADSGWICGAGGTILSTMDGGEHWYQRGRVPASVSFVELHFTDSGLGWFVATSGEVFRYLDNSIAQVPSRHPLPGHLELVAYPNPFNNSTTLTVSVLSRATMTITLHDILGRKVREFEYRPAAAGVQRIPLDASALSSGSYFVQISTTDVVFPARVTLIK